MWGQDEDHKGGVRERHEHDERGPARPVLAGHRGGGDLQTGGTLAQGADRGLTGGTTDWDAIVEVLPARDIVDKTSRGAGTWVAYAHTNPVTGQEEAKRAWLVMHDGLVFGSGYYLSDIIVPGGVLPSADPQARYCR